MIESNFKSIFKTILKNEAMENEKNKESENKSGSNEHKTGANQNKTESSQSNPFGGFAGFDFKSLNIPEWALHVLTGIGAMGGNYFLWIKPMQDKMDEMNRQLTTQDNRIRELEYEMDNLIRIIKRDYNEQGEKKEDFFEVNRESKLGKSSGRRFTKM